MDIMCERMHKMLTQMDRAVGRSHGLTECQRHEVRNQEKNTDMGYVIVLVPQLGQEQGGRLWDSKNSAYSRTVSVTKQVSPKSHI